MEEVDFEKKFETIGNVCIVHGAIAIDVDDSGVATEAIKQPHMTVFHRKNPRWTQQEVDLMQQKVNEFKKINKIQTNVTKQITKNNILF